jgi:hypothetical protein
LSTLLDGLIVRYASQAFLQRRSGADVAQWANVADSGLVDLRRQGSFRGRGTPPPPLADDNEAADGALKMQTVEFEYAGKTISYEGVTDSPVLDFSQVKWRSSPERQAMIDQFIADRAHPFDVLPIRAFQTGGGQTPAARGMVERAAGSL